MAVNGSPSPELTQVLRRVDLFSQFPTTELAALGQRLQRKRYHAGQVIFQRGDPGSSLLLITSGQVRIALTSSAGKEVLLTLLGPGDFFGDLALLDGEPRSADALAHTECELWSLQRTEFLGFLEAHASVAKDLLSIMSHRLRRNADLIEEVAFLDVGARLARLLLSLMAERGSRSEDRVVIAGKLTQSDLANMVGATRESVNKWLATYQRQGLVAWDKTQLIVRDPEGLRERAAA